MAFKKEQVKPQARILLVGNPNVGKTALFNWLTQSHGHIANYPGVTVEIKTANLTLPSGRLVEIMDLPGVYGLFNKVEKAEDEQIAFQIICDGLKKISIPEYVVIVLDANQLERNLYLFLELCEIRKPALGILTLIDEARENRFAVDMKKLSERLNMPFVLTSALEQKGRLELCRQLDLMVSKGIPPVLNPPAVDENISELGSKIHKRYQKIETLLQGIVTSLGYSHIQRRTNQIDSWLLHPIGGLLCMGVVFCAFFGFIFSLSKPLVDLLQQLNRQLADLFNLLFAPDSLLGSLLVEGVLAGVGNVVAFVPSIALLFIFIGILQDTGYLARVTFLFDGIFTRFGLSGRAVVPFLSAFACAVPAILSTRVIESRRSRLLTILVVPLMACSARLPVYVLLIAAVFSQMPPLFGFLPVGSFIMMSLYAFGVIMALLMAVVLRYTLLKGKTPSFVLELPPYRMPDMRAILYDTFRRIKIFLTDAGGTILAVSIVLWALFSFPRISESEALQGLRSSRRQVEHSYAGQLGHWIEPVIKPLGFDWKMGIGLIASFAARETFISSLGVIYSMEQEGAAQSVSLPMALAQDRDPLTQKPRYTPLTALSLMVFFALSMQCMSTLAAVRKETKSWRWPVFQFGYMTILAWVCSFLVYQGGLLLGFS